jgi:transcriptional regulator with XRE-family HTH domain
VSSGPDHAPDDAGHHDVAGQAAVARELRRYRERAGLSRTELARRVGYSRTYISTSEKPGADLISKAVVTQIDDELGAGGALIAVHARAEAERRARRARVDTESATSASPPATSRISRLSGAPSDAERRAWRVPADTERQVAAESVGGPSEMSNDAVRASFGGRSRGDSSRREVLGLVGGVIADGLLLPAEHTRRLVDSALKSAPSESDTDEWEYVANEYSRLIGSTVPVATVLADLLADFDEIRARVESVSDELRCRLVRVVCLLAALIAIALLCAGRRLESNRYWRTAQRAADSTEDLQLAGLIRGRRAVYEVYQPRADRQRILDLAEAAIGVSGLCASVGRASGLAARAQILAMSGAGSAAVEVLRELERDFERLPNRAPADDSSQWSWSEQRLRFVQSFVHSYVGNVSEAHTAQEAALLLYPASSCRGPAQIEFHRAIAMVADGDHDGGAQHVLDVLEAVPHNIRADRMILQPASFALDTLRHSEKAVRAKRGAQELIQLSVARS